MQEISGRVGDLETSACHIANSLIERFGYLILG